MLFLRCLLVQLVILGSFAVTVRPIDFTTPDLTELEQYDSVPGDAFSTEFIETTTAQQQNFTSEMAQTAITSTPNNGNTITTTIVAGEALTTESVASTVSDASLTTGASHTTGNSLIVTADVTASSAYLIAGFTTLLLFVL